MKITKLGKRIMVAVVAAGVAIPLTAVGASASTYSGGAVSCSGGHHVVVTGTGQGTIKLSVVDSSGVTHSKSDGASSSLPWFDSWNTGLTKVKSWKVSGTYVTGGSAACG